MERKILPFHKSRSRWVADGRQTQQSFMLADGHSRSYFSALHKELQRLDVAEVNNRHYCKG